MDVNPILIPILVPLFVFVMIIFIRRYENKEKMAMIEKGIDPGTFKSQPQRSSGGLKFALLAIGAGIGLLFGSFLEASTDINEEVAYFSMLFIFGGLGLLIAYTITEKKLKKEKEESI